MNDSELVSKIKQLPLEETRTDSPELFEFVIGMQQIGTLIPVLDDYFGPPVKPPNKQPSRDVLQYTESLGGIRKDQTFYYREKGDSSELAMIWPWGDGAHATVKIVSRYAVRLAPDSRGMWRKMISRISAG